MTALTKDVTRKVEVTGARQLVSNFGSGTFDPTATFYQGALCMYDTSDDLIKPAEVSTTGVALGVAQYHVAQGEAKDPWIETGCRPFANSAAADLIENHDAGARCYMVDDDTVALTDGTGTRSVAGVIIRVDSDGVWVSTNPYLQG